MWHLMVPSWFPDRADRPQKAAALEEGGYATMAAIVVQQEGRMLAALARTTVPNLRWVTLDLHSCWLSRRSL
jgi:hypothetical protein